MYVCAHARVQCLVSLCSLVTLRTSSVCAQVGHCETLQLWTLSTFNFPSYYTATTIVILFTTHTHGVVYIVQLNAREWLPYSSIQLLYMYMRYTDVHAYCIIMITLLYLRSIYGYVYFETTKVTTNSQGLRECVVNIYKILNLSLLLINNYDYNFT